MALGFLRECLPGRFERNTRNLSSLAAYSRDSLRALRAATGIEYDQRSRGILHLCTGQAEYDALSVHAEALRGAGMRREVMRSPRDARTHG